MTENDAPATCPKCEAPRSPGRPDCPRCGLVFDRLPADYDPLWGDVNDADGATARHLAEHAEEAWDDEAAHGRFVEFCRQKGKLDLAMRFYRQKAKDDPDDAIAPRQLASLEKIFQFAYLDAVEQRRPGPDRSRRRRRIVAYVVILIAVAIMLYITLSQFTAITRGGGVSPYHP